MRRLASTVLLALLAACTVTTTGAPCGSDLECPSDQGCGSDGRCGIAALSCPGHTTAGQCQPGTSCSAGQLVTCTAGSGVCSTGPVASDCPVHQECFPASGSATCRCSATRCSASTASFCGPGGQVVSCAQDVTGSGCWYEASSTACGDPGTACQEGGGSAACACPTTDACTQLDASRCGAGSGPIQVCRPVASGSACLTWQPGVDCSAGGLVCSGGACACPANPGTTFVADAVGGSPAGAPPGPTGLDSPVACRYRTLTDALTRANASGTVATVRARGWPGSGPAVVFSEPGTLTAGPGVTLTTDDAIPDPVHYAVTTAAVLTGAFVTLGPGSSVSGLEIRNSASTGAGIEIRCPTSADVAPVSLSGVAISGSGTGTPAVRFVSGLLVEGHCPVSMSGGSVTGAGTGVSIGASGSGAPGFSATGTAFRSNAGDAVYVARGTFTSDACPYADNGTHVHAQPVGGSGVNVTVQNSSGAARMTGATNSAFRLLAMGSGSALVLGGNEVVDNTASQDYNVASGLRRGGGMVLTPPLPGSSAITGSTFARNKFDQVFVAADAGTLNLHGDATCGSLSNSFACYDGAYVGVLSNGARVDTSWCHWTHQPGAYGVDVAGTGVTGYDTSACSASTISCQ